MDWIDLRSDTVSHPTPEMWQAMGEAELGDDVYGDDPTVNELQRLSAQMLGKEAGLFVPSGTMGNLAAVLAHCDRGDEAILGDQAHQFLKEAGGMSALGGIHVRTVRNTSDGRLPLAEVENAIRAPNPHHPRSRLICYENTHNMCWGAVLPAEHGGELGELARRNGLRLHLDGARIFNAAAALGLDPAELAAPADSVTFCLSKALCAPIGSVLCGGAEFIQRASRMRKVLGGGMRQAGVVAAAGIVALKTMPARLIEDHGRAERLAQGLLGVDGLTVLNPKPASNMVYLEFDPAVDRAVLVERAQAAGIRIKARGARQMRLVTHYWIDNGAVEEVLAFFRAAVPS